ncbi:MAG TPA: hypothetical protein VF258_08365, partial [Luteolibacter sp.]
MPYGELKSLITDAAREPAFGNEPALLSARFRLAISEGQPVVDAVFRTTTFADGLVKVPLVGGDVTVATQKPSEARVLIQERMLCQALEKAGAQVLELRLLPVSGTNDVTLEIPPCPASIFETGDLGEDSSVALKIDGREQVYGSNRTIALPLAGGPLEIRLLGGEETREARRPPEPSAWTWQHQALVIPGDGEMIYRVLCRASATAGSGVSATLMLPADAREVEVTGDDLTGQKVIRGADRSLGLRLDWKTRGLLEREVVISYQLPRRPLDRSWKLQAPAAPGVDTTRTRFSVASVPELTYAADGLAGPFPPKGLPARLTGEFGSTPCFHLEAGTSVELVVNPRPVVPTAEATVGDSAWIVKLEPDGAMLLEGAMNVEHGGMIGVILDVPKEMTLLSCKVGGQSVTPVNLGDGKLEVSLPAAGVRTQVTCSFTGRTAAIEPVEGVLDLALPKTPLFIRSLSWKIEMPPNYQAETHGNLIR